MDDTMMTLPQNDRGRWNREVGEELWRRKKAEDDRRKRDEIMKNSLLPVYWPFGLPGGGAPNTYSNRRQKFKHRLPDLIENRIPNLPGTRKRVKFSDPELRFQFHPDVRRSVDIHWRYGFLPEIKAAYRLELERQMADKEHRRTEERKKWWEEEAQKQGMNTDFGRTGPGGNRWSQPRRVGMNFLHSLGWTGEKAFRRLEDQMDGSVPQHLMIKDKEHHHYTTPEEAFTGGIEIVPMMARRRSFKKSSHLPSCDVTNTAITHRREAWQDMPGPEDYMRDLNAQVNTKRGQMKMDREEDMKIGQRHLDTWNSLWGRPGHGAPRAGGEKCKGHLGKLLYRESGVLWPKALGHKAR